MLKHWVLLWELVKGTGMLEHWVLLWELGKGTRNVRTVGVASRIGTGDWQDILTVQ